MGSNRILLILYLKNKLKNMNFLKFFLLLLSITYAKPRPRHNKNSHWLENCKDKRGLVRSKRDSTWWNRTLNKLYVQQFKRGQKSYYDQLSSYFHQNPELIRRMSCKDRHKLEKLLKRKTP